MISHGFDDDFVEEDGCQGEIFLDELEVGYFETEPSKILDDGHGTIIEVTNLKGAWSDVIVKRLCDDVSSLTDPVSRIVGT